MKLLYSIAFLLFSSVVFAQSDAKNPFNLVIINDLASYKENIKNNPNNELIEIKKAIPSIALDIRYATKNNFMKQRMYSQARAFARKPVVEKLEQVQEALKKKGLGLKIYDAYRPYAVTLSFYEKASDKNFVANPNKGSKHNRGCAVDLTLIDLKTKKELAMPTPYDSFAPEAAANYVALRPEVQKNRDYLIAIMHANGFRVIPNEWWHFDFIGWEKYGLMDIPFEKL